MAIPTAKAVLPVVRMERTLVWLAPMCGGSGKLPRSLPSGCSDAKSLLVEPVARARWTALTPNPCLSGELAAYIASGHDCLTSSAWQAAPAGSLDPCPALGTWNATTTTWSCNPSTSGSAPEYDTTYLQCLSAGLGFVGLCDNAGWATSLVSGFGAPP